MNTANKIFQSNVYINGENFAGRAEEITLPEVLPKMIDHKSLSTIGELEIAAGFSKMSTKIKWNGVYPSVFKSALNVYNSLTIQVRANIEVYNSGGRTAQQPCVIFMTVTSKKLGGLGFKQMDNVDLETEYNVTAYKLEINGEEICDIDVPNNIYRAFGVDYLAEMRANIGV